ncbi:hypothetical protein [Nocardia pseudovaccinii]|uniref:hypothetical protein n=1 Tax=Nocardia pseudovaccinii TaxID=189540 RepID=UPI0007A51C43|nr:hypothetical protein [Nocardia pseudovaccinii]
MVHAIQAASEVGNYAEVAVLPDETDPQIYLSRNWLPQPFHLICEKDTVLSQLSGTARVELRNSSVNSFRMDIGDHIYIPAGTPHRLAPISESVTIRYLPLRGGLQAAAWFCAACGNEVRRYEWEHDNNTAALEFYWLACARFNAGTDSRTCGTCSTIHPKVNLATLGMPSTV